MGETVEKKKRVRVLTEEQKAERAAYQKKYREANAEAIAASKANWAAKNGDRLKESKKAYQKAWWATNPDKALECSKRSDAARKELKVLASKGDAAATAKYEEKLAKYRERTKAWVKANPHKKSECDKAYRAKNLIASRERSRAWVKANPERTAEHKRKYAESNKQEVIDRAKAWNKAHPEVAGRITAARRSRALTATPLWSDDELNQLLIEEAYRLRDERTKATGVKHEVDHILPLRGRLVSGLNVGLNLQIIPASLNSKKNNKFDPAQPDAWLWPHGSAYTT